MADVINESAVNESLAREEKPQHYTYLNEFRTKQCPEFLQHKCSQHRPFTCFNWHFANQKRRRPVQRKDGTFSYSADMYCTKFDETTGLCPDGDDCPLLHRTAGDTERRYHIRYYKTCPCVYETDSKGNCSKNGPHCAFAHGHADLRKPVYDVRELDGGVTSSSLMETPLSTSLESDRLLNEDPVWNDPKYVLTHYKTELCRRPLRLCRQGYACPSYHNPRDKRRSPAVYKYRSTPCPNVKQGDEWGEPSKCENGDNCGYCHTRTEQQFHLEIYKSTKCNDMVQTGYCPRGLFCAFAHVEHEMNTQWDVSVPDSTLAAYVNDALAPLLNGKKDEKPAAAADVKHLAPGEERTRRHTMPSIPSCAELSVSITEAPGSSFVSSSGGFLTSANVMSPHMSSWHMPMPDHVTSSQGGDMLSSSLNDSYLSSYFTRSATHSNDIQQQLQRPSAMSFGSYQQFCEQRRQTAAAAAAAGAGDAGIGFDMQLPSHYPAVGNTSPRLPANFYGAAPGASMYPPHAAVQASQLPSSFFASPDAASQPLPGFSRDDDLDLNLNELNLECLDEPMENQATRGGVLGASANFPPSGFVGVPGMLPGDTDIKSQSSLLNGSSVVNRPPPAPIGLTQQLRLQQQMQQQLQQRGVTPSLFSHPPPGLMGGQPALPLQQPDLPVYAPADVPGDEVARLRQELLTKKQAILRWEDGMKQAYSACEAWKNEAEKQERLLRQVEEERNKAFARRDSTLAHLAEMRHELDILGGGSAAPGGMAAPVQALRGLQRNIDFQQVPHATVQQLHTTIQHDFELVEQMIRSIGVCLMCNERRATVCVSPCSHTAICYTCAMIATECPQCGAHISPPSTSSQPMA